jgi:hypothetical protein
MRKLAGAELATATRTPSRLMPKRASSKRRWQVLSAVFAVVFLLASAGAAWKGLFPWQQHAKPASNVTSINLADNNLFCPTFAAWSPDGQQVAVLAKLEACSNPDAGIITPNVVAVLDTRGNLVRQIDIDASIPGYTKASTPSSLVYPQFWGLVWALDGKRVMLPFWMIAGPDNTSFLAMSGVVVAPVDGQAVKAITSAAFYGYDYWDIQANHVIHSNTNLPIATAYQWSSDGKLIAAPHPSTTAPVGNPSGGQSFTMWQPGTVLLDRKKSVLSFNENMTILSPDDRYLIPVLGSGGELDSAATDYAQGSDGEYHVAPRDKGLMAAAIRLKNPADPYASQTSVAWRADGKLIAATDPNLLIDQIVANLGSDFPAASQSVTIFDSATGSKVLTLKTQPLANRLRTFGGLTPQPALAWNAKGNRLSFLDTNFDMLTIWNVNLNLN